MFRFICVEFRIPIFEFFYYNDISNETFGLDFNLFIIYNFDFIIADGDFFEQLKEQLYW